MSGFDLGSRSGTFVSIEKKRFVAVALALASVLVGAGCPDVGGVTGGGGKEDPVTIFGTWSGTLTATFTDNTTASINLTYWIPPNGPAAFGIDNNYSAQLITQQTTSNVLTVTTNPPDISADAFGSVTATTTYAVGSTTLTPTAVTGQIPVGDRSKGLAVLKTVKSMSGALSRTYTYQNNLSPNFAILSGTVKYFDKFLYGVEGAVVSSSLDTRTTVADKNGNYFLVGNFLQPANPNIVPYTVTFTRSGFRTTGWKQLFGDTKWNANYEIKKGVGNVLYDRSKIWVEGTVTVAMTNGVVGAPIAGATVSTTADSRTTVTDATGWFFILTSVDAIGHNDIYNLIISAPGYVPWNKPLDGRDTYTLSRVP